MENQIVLLDVDSTLLNQNYQLTVSLEQLKAEVLETQNRGIKIGLNSDSALPFLRTLAKSWGMEGPIVAERGALIEFADGDVLYSNTGASFFPDFLRNVQNELLRPEYAEKFLVVNGNVNPICNSLPIYPHHSLHPQTSILMNSLRTRSFSCFVRSLESGSWTKNKLHLEEIFELILSVSKRMGVENLLEWDVNADYGICIVHHKETNKFIAGEGLLSKTNSKLFMVGDSMADFMNHKSITHMAVGNATPDYKKISAYVSPYELTEGVIDILKHVI